MANSVSAAKRARQAETHRLQNLGVRGTVGTVRAKFLKAVADGSRDEALSLFKEFCSVVDKALKSGVIKPNTAGRKKSRAAARLNGLLTAAA